jgi:hypothetical protein
MSVLTGLDAIRAKIAERPTAGDRVDDRELTRNMKSGSSRNIRFLQELDENSELYNPELGLGLVVALFEHPNLYWLKLVDTSDEGGSYPAEQGTWTSKLVLYINVIDVDTNEVFFLERSVLGGLGQTVVDSAFERGKLTDGVWKIKRTGEKKATRYEFQATDFGKAPVEVSADDLIDFRKSVLKEIPYEEQERFVKGIEAKMAAKGVEINGLEAGAPAAPGADDDVW